MIQKLREFQIGQFVREDGPQSHLKKTGTPTMGGVLICIAILLPTVLWSDPANPFVWVTVFSTLAFGAIGFADDYIKVVQRRSLGLTRAGQAVLAGHGRQCSSPSRWWCSTSSSCFPRASPCRLSRVCAPTCCGITGPARCRTWRFSPLCHSSSGWSLVLVGSSNAVNLTDGLDGLAIGCTIIAAGALAVLTYVSGHVVFADYLELQRMPLVGELTVFCGSMVGASIGFLWYNAHPAEIFMGDVGSLALGGAIGTVAIIIRQELLLPFIGGIFILEALSVMLQVGSYKLRKKAHLQDGAAAPPLRATGLERVQGDRALLDWRPGVCIVCTHHAEIALERAAHAAARRCTIRIGAAAEQPRCRSQT